ncbi:MAG: F-type H+-transporting ATPase subunit b [Planctomycetota bacterium]|jgi:F-type H+-transporting ATPase subunit b
MNILEILSKIGFDWQVALANLVNFLIIFWILKKFAFGPIKKVLDDRRSAISAGVENATAAEATLKDAETTAAIALSDAQTSANEVISKAKNTGDEMVSRARDAASAEGLLVLEEAKKQAELASSEAMQDFRRKASSLVVSAVGRVLSDTMDKNLNEKITKLASINFVAK